MAHLTPSSILRWACIALMVIIPLSESSAWNFTKANYTAINLFTHGDLILHKVAANGSIGCNLPKSIDFQPNIQGRRASRDSFTLEYRHNESFANSSSNNLEDMARVFSDVIGLLTTKDTVSEVLQCTTTKAVDSCLSVYQCILETWNADAEEFFTCAAASQQTLEPWKCYFRLTKGEDDIESCGGGRALEQSLWQDNNVDNLSQIMLNGGIDNSYDFVWVGHVGRETFSQTLGRQLLNNGGLSCSLEHPCTDEKTCDEVGSWTAIALGKTGKVYPALWTYLFYVAFKNLNQQMSNQYNEMKDAIQSLALDDFNIGTYFPKKNQQFSFRNAFSGLGGIFAILAGFIPLIGPELAAVGATVSAAGTIASGASEFLGNAIAASSDSLDAQSIFSKKVLGFYSAFIAALEDAVFRLFKGETIGGPSGFNVTDLMKNGTWLDPQTVSNVSDLNRKMRVEILSRSLDSMWKTFPSNKMWVTFLDLKDSANGSKCLADSTGPNSSKYCDDGGVYYTYNFVESGHLVGQVDYPWGAKNLSDLKIEFSSIAKASAKSFRLMRRIGGDPFNFTQINGTSAFLNEVLGTTGSTTDLSESAGQYPGSWTLAVCDMSTWGAGWNFDYEKNKYSPNDRVNLTHPPCLCGPGGNETYAWARAAGMQNFKTFEDRCKRALLRRGFQWPDGLAKVDYPVSDDKGKNYTVGRPK